MIDEKSRSIGTPADHETPAHLSGYSRRDSPMKWTKWTACLGLGFAILTFSRALEATAAERPNIVYILLDDAGYGDLSCYGQQKFKTPNIDRLATEGMRFTQHYSGSTVCAPTRSVLMTGLHTGHTPVRGNKEIKPIGQHPIPADTLTIAEQLKAAGYATGAFGKWGLGFPGSEGDPLAQGFDRFFGYNCQRRAHTYYPEDLQDDDRRIPIGEGVYAHDQIMDEAFKWLKEQGDRPFFCYLPVTIPHAALHVPEEDAAPFRKLFPEFEDVVGKYSGPEIRNPPAMFAGMMTRLDRQIGQLMALLKELGVDDNTVVMLSSDNGPHREGGHKPEFFNSNGGLTGFKRDLTEGGIRAPLIVRWPGHVQPGTTSDLISAHWDVFPTVCEIAGLDAPANLDGISFYPTLVGDSQRQRKHDYLYWEFHERGGKRAVRFGENGRWKAIQVDLNKPQPEAIVLYDLSTDPAEQNDLAPTHGKLVDQARDLFEQAHRTNPIWKFRWEN